MNILGIGKTGCSIAEKFNYYPQYEVFKVGTSIDTTTNCYAISERNNPEDYDRDPINPLFRIDGDLDVVLSGDDPVIASTLRVLENYKDCNIRIFYIKPNYKFLSETQKTLDKVVYNVLQEYTRSKRFDSMYILEYESLVKMIGKVPITQVQSKIYETVCNTVHMINFLDNNDPVMSNFQEMPETYCINTLAMMDVSTGEEKLLYDLDNVREKRYYYCINQKQLETDNELFDKVNTQINSKFEENTNIMFGIYSSQYSDNYCYVVHKSPYIQS